MLKKDYTASNKLKIAEYVKTDTSGNDISRGLERMLLRVFTHSAKSKKPIAKHGKAYRLNTKEAFKMVISNRSQNINFA